MHLVSITLNRVFYHSDTSYSTTTPKIHFQDTFSDELTQITFLSPTTIAASSMDGSISFLDLSIEDENDAIYASFNANNSSIQQFIVSGDCLYAITHHDELFVWTISTVWFIIFSY